MKPPLQLLFRGKRNKKNHSLHCTIAKVTSQHASNQAKFHSANYFLFYSLENKGGSSVPEFDPVILKNNIFKLKFYYSELVRLNFF
jgi:hypothetical protein